MRSAAYIEKERFCRLETLPCSITIAEFSSQFLYAADTQAAALGEEVAAGLLFEIIPALEGPPNERHIGRVFVVRPADDPRLAVRTTAHSRAGTTASLAGALILRLILTARPSRFMRSDLRSTSGSNTTYPAAPIRD